MVVDSCRSFWAVRLELSGFPVLLIAGILSFRSADVCFLGVVASTEGAVALGKCCLVPFLRAGGGWHPADRVAEAFPGVDCKEWQGRSTFFRHMLQVYFFIGFLKELWNRFRPSLPSRCEVMDPIASMCNLEGLKPAREELYWRWFWCTCLVRWHMHFSRFLGGARRGWSFMAGITGWKTTMGL